MLTTGTPAPDFTAQDQHGNAFTLSSLRGHEVILYFYPKDDTPGCTKEACNLRDNHDRLLAMGYKVVGVSTDDVASHKKFAQKYELPFPLVADVEQKIVNAYGVWVEKNMYGKKYMGTARVTYVIDAQGVIQQVFDKVKVEEHTEQIVEAAGR